MEFGSFTERIKSGGGNHCNIFMFFVIVTYICKLYYTVRKRVYCDFNLRCKLYYTVRKRVFGDFNLRCKLYYIVRKRVFDGFNLRCKIYYTVRKPIFSHLTTLLLDDALWVDFYGGGPLHFQGLFGIPRHSADSAIFSGTDFLHNTFIYSILSRR